MRVSRMFSVVLALALALTASRAFCAVRTLYVPTSASIHGNAGAYFHTDVWAFNRSFTSPLSVTARYRCFAGPCGYSSIPFSLAPRESKLFSDIDATLFRLPETAGAIEFQYASSFDDLVVTSRTYTPNIPQPTNGTSIPAATIVDARSRSVFLGLCSNGGNLGSGFRTNAGAFYPGTGDFTSSVTYSLYRSDGTLIGSTTRTLGTATAGQVNDIFGAVGAGSMVTTNAYLVVTATRAVLPFVTVIDNQSGDSIFVAAAPDEPAPPATSLLVNGDFDSGIASWTSRASYITTAPAPADSYGTPGSGSILVRNTGVDTHGGGSGPSQCVAGLPGQLLNLGGRVYVSSAQNATGITALSLFFYGGGSCGGTYLGSCGSTPTLTTHTDQWLPLTGTCGVPAGAQSALFMAETVKVQGSGDFVVYFDDLSVTASAR